MFPLDKPYKLLYSINCLITCLREESLQPHPSEDFIARSIRNLLEFLTCPEMGESLETQPLKLSFAYNIVDGLLVALTGKDDPGYSAFIRALTQT
jgi:ubiquitin carboxyl-terminal hydrolase 34